jgi:NTP-dependent ternary system trypsin peptidase co-occuring protein
MRRYVQANTPGGELLVETGEGGDSLENNEGLESVGAGDRLPSFEEASAAMKKNAEYLLNIMRELSPAEISISCGLKVGAEGGNSFWGLAKVSGEASYTLTIKWRDARASNGD